VIGHFSHRAIAKQPDMRGKPRSGGQTLRAVPADCRLRNDGAIDPDGLKLFARNQLPGTVAALTPGAVNAEVLLDLDGGGTLAATVTQASADSLGLAPGVRATTFFKASSVILAVAA
jgi:molybdopterin-binding protein